MKLGFVDGSTPKPAEGSEEYDQWVRTDSLVLSWILNSISKDIVESFLYVDTARDLWLEIEERYGVSNGPLVYQLQREIASATQGTLSVSAYFAKLKTLWDELGCLLKPEVGAVTEQGTLQQRDHLMQFLMGLNDTFESIRGQILMLEPLPTATKAYAMVKGFQGGRQIGAKNQWRKKTAQEKKSQVCIHCGKSGHLKESCFEIFGYPDWYKNLMEQRKGGGIGSSRAFNATADQTSGHESVQNAMDGEAVAELIRRELRRLMDENSSETLNGTRLTEFEDFAGRLLGKLYILDENSFKTDLFDVSLKENMELGLAIKSLDVNLWHKRLGHSSANVLGHLQFLNEIKTPLELCEICPLAKQPRDVVFHEGVFPYSEKQLDPVTCPLPICLDDTNSVPLNPDVNNKETLANAPIELPDTTIETDSCIDAHSKQKLRRSSRISVKPSWMQDFQCNYTTISDSPPLITACSSLHTCFLASLTKLQEPRSYQQACKSAEWRQAMQIELDALHKNNT
ncbi:UNVERIFIED_CONTAM: hypothetical protein Sradi_1488200 [Sesamum radiatum]|uniref:CCHC-type domain-containing protein n=1 Tax=Sesamum radiatum TaxID=300843 RepID=A0AAW2U7H0_SESRA